jgi:hypothetical protein
MPDDAPSVGCFQLAVKVGQKVCVSEVLDTATGQVWFEEHLANTPPKDADYLKPKVKAAK